MSSISAQTAAKRSTAKRQNGLGSSLQAPGEGASVELRNVVKYYSSQRALNGVNLTMAPGELGRVIGRPETGVLRFPTRAISATTTSRGVPARGRPEGRRPLLLRWSPSTAVLKGDMSLPSGPLAGRYPDTRL